MDSIPSSSFSSKVYKSNQRQLKLNPINYVIYGQYDANFRIKDTFFKRRLTYAKNLYCHNLNSHYGCVNAIEFSNEGELLISGQVKYTKIQSCVCVNVYDGTSRKHFSRSEDLTRWRSYGGFSVFISPPS